MKKEIRLKTTVKMSWVKKKKICINVHMKIKRSTQSLKDVRKCCKGQRDKIVIYFTHVVQSTKHPDRYLNR